MDNKELEQGMGMEDLLPEWVLNSKMIGLMHRDDFTSHRYRFLFTKVKYGLFHRVIEKKETETRVIVFPFQKRTEHGVVSSEYAAYAENEDTFNCTLKFPGKRNAFGLMCGNQFFVVNCRWEDDLFCTLVSENADLAENQDSDQWREEMQGKSDCLFVSVGDRDIHVMPILFENEDGYAPFIAVIHKKGTNEYTVAATREYLSYDGLKLGCYWDENILKCYQIL